MVHLSLLSPKGNAGLRYFPCSGYLGLTPVRVEGVVRTRLDSDQKPLQAKLLTISVRCYESRTRVNSKHYNVLADYTQVLWSKPDNVEYEGIGNLEYPFRITIPAKVAGFSNAVFVDYRCMWRVEAVLSHIPISGVGVRQIRHFDLSLVRYDVPSWSPPVPAPHLSLVSGKPRAPRVKYSVHAPTGPIGPLDLVSIPIHLQPVDQDVSIRSANVVVERRITLSEVTSSSSISIPSGSLKSKSSSSSLGKPLPSPLLSPSPPSPSHSPSGSSKPLPKETSDPTSSSLSLDSSNPTITPGTIYPSAVSLASETSPLLAAPPPANSPNTLFSSSSPFPSKVIASSVAGAESSGTFARDQNGVFTKTLTLQWPSAQSRSRWAIGETISSDLVAVRFFLRTKIIVNSPSGTDTIELADNELFIVSTNETERQLALSKYNDAQETVSFDSTRSKSKSPRRNRTERAEEGAVPPSPSVNTAATGSGSSSSKPPSSMRKSQSRRPHTSAGPRDKPVDFAGGAYGATRGQEGEASGVSPSHGTSAGNGVGGLGIGGSSTSAAAKRRSELITRSSTTRPDSRDSHGSGKKLFSSRLCSPGSGGVGGGGGGNGSGSVHSSKLSGSSNFWSTSHSNGNSSSPRLKEAPSGSSTSTTASMSSDISTSSLTSVSIMDSSSEPNSTPNAPPRHVVEWEEELARIEVKSRRSSDLLGFFRKRKRSTAVPVPAVLPEETRHKV